MLKDLPLDFSKYLDMAVDDVWLINPCPENLIKKIPINKNTILLIFEKTKDERKSRIITENE